MQFSIPSIKTGETTPSDFLHKELDDTSPGTIPRAAELPVSEKRHGPDRVPRCRAEEIALDFLHSASIRFSKSRASRRLVFLVNFL
jgi:hypothetical protein